MFWQDIELRLYPDPFYASYQISKINRSSRSKTPMNPKIPFKYYFMDTIPAISSNFLTEYTTFDNCLLIVDVYSKNPKLYRMEHITSEEVMDKLDMFQAIFGKVYKFIWWYMEIIQTNAGTQFISNKFQEGPYGSGLLGEVSNKCPGFCKCMRFSKSIFAALSNSSGCQN